MLLFSSPYVLEGTSKGTVKGDDIPRPLRTLAMEAREIRTRAALHGRGQTYPWAVFLPPRHWWSQRREPYHVNTVPGI